jgi:hypothetical protein
LIFNYNYHSFIIIPDEGFGEDLKRSDFHI